MHDALMRGIEKRDLVISEKGRVAQTANCLRRHGGFMKTFFNLKKLLGLYVVSGIYVFLEFFVSLLQTPPSSF